VGPDRDLNTSPWTGSVAVVIPTTGRSTLLRSVNSALGQTRSPERVLVVVDGPVARVGPDVLPDDPRVVVLSTGGGRGPGAARNLGVAHAGGTDFVAFLDDDDYWVSTKLEYQVAAACAQLADGAAHVMVSVRQLIVSEDGRIRARSPRRMIRTGEDLASYLFTRTRVWPGEAAMGASMVLCDTPLAVRVPFRGEAIHEDWGWLIQASDVPGCRVVGLAEDLSYYTATTRSASSAIGWRESVAWIRHRSDRIARRQRGDFLLAVSAPLALRSRDLRGLAEVVAVARRETSPGVAAWVSLVLLSAQVFVKGWWHALSGHVRRLGSSRDA
jgi:hypothetical protein